MCCLHLKSWFCRAFHHLSQFRSFYVDKTPLLKLLSWEKDFRLLKVFFSSLFSPYYLLLRNIARVSTLLKRFNCLKSWCHWCLTRSQFLSLQRAPTFMLLELFLDWWQSDLFFLDHNLVCSLRLPRNSLKGFPYIPGRCEGLIGERKIGAHLYGGLGF